VNPQHMAWIVWPAGNRDESGAWGITTGPSGRSPVPSERVLEPTESRDHN